MYDHDGLTRQRDAEVKSLDGRIVPRLHLTEEYLGQRWTIDDEAALADAIEIDHRNDAPHDHWELHEAALGQFVAGERCVRRAEHDGLGLDLLDPAAGTDRLVFEPDAGLFLICIRPLAVDRIRKGCAGA